jgi:hypothetical protein
LREYGIKRPEWEKGGSMGWQARAAQAKELEQNQKEAATSGTLAQSLGLNEVTLASQRNVDLPGVDRTMLDRSTLDRSLSDNIEPQGNLDVNVKAPAGTEVKADGDGMFKGNVSLDRQMELPTLQ